MTGHAEIQERWRRSAADRLLASRLLEAGCPVGLREILENTHLLQPSLREWAQGNLRAGRMLRTSQAELIVSGRTLAEIAAVTGVSVRLVLYYLAEPEWESDRFDTALAVAKPDDQDNE